MKCGDLIECYRQVLLSWFGKDEGRPFINKAVRRIAELWGENKLIVVEAPTGYGKSAITATISLYNSVNGFKTLAVYPLRSLLKDQHSKLAEVIPSKYLGRRHMHEAESPFLIRPVTLTTLDTFSLTLMGLPPEELSKVYQAWEGTSYGSLGHFMFSWATTFLSDVILDEVQLVADETKSLNFLYALVKLYLDAEGKLIFMSATIPNSLKEVLKEASNGRVEFISFSHEDDPEFVNGRCSKNYEVRLVEGRPSAKEVISAYEEVGGRGIAVFNTVAEAVEFYREIKDKVSAVLLHSRFTMQDRDRIQKEVRELEEGIVVTTQVIEAGMDVSSNFMMTDVAPANSLVQRAGRFLRYGESKGTFLVFYEGTSGRRYKVYDAELVERTWNFLKERDGEVSLHLPEGCNNRMGFSEMIDQVYQEYRVNRRDVDAFLRPLLNLESGSKKAVEIFYEMEGSFVRSGQIVPVITRLEDLPNGVVPISFSQFSKISGNVRAVSKREAKGCKKVSEHGEYLIVELSGRVRNPKDLITKTIRCGIVAFLVDGTYSREEGLRVGG